MVKYSVKKPFTVLVAVIVVIVLGFISVTRMSMDLEQADGRCPRHYFACRKYIYDKR